MAVCTGNSTEHCCWINGVVCPYLEENTVEGRRWACGLLRKLGSWEAVYDSSEYQTSDAAAMFTAVWPGFGCGDWPQDIPGVLASPSGNCCWQGDG